MELYCMHCNEVFHQGVIIDDSYGGVLTFCSQVCADAAHEEAWAEMEYETKAYHEALRLAGV